MRQAMAGGAGLTSIPQEEKAEGVLISSFPQVSSPLDHHINSLALPRF